jgi:predicted DNA-binding transcriptional regulator YafY
MSDPAGRLLKLLAFLQTPRSWTGAELAARLEVTPRTIRRDVDRLRDLGYPVEAALGAVGGYRLVAGASMPPLLLDDEEAVAVAIGLRTVVGASIAGGDEAAARALAKLGQVLPPRLRARVAMVAATTASLAWDEQPIDPERFALLSRAIASRERVRFDYRAADGSTGLRTVEPNAVVAANRFWYLVAWDPERADWRSFRLDRIGDPRTLPGRLPPRDLPGGDAAAWLRRSIEERAPTPAAAAVVQAPATEVARRLPTGAATIEPIDAGRCRIRLTPDTIHWHAMRLLRLDVEFEVESPPELVEYLGELAGRAARSARGAR